MQSVYRQRNTQEGRPCVSEEGWGEKGWVGSDIADQIKKDWQALTFDAKATAKYKMQSKAKSESR